MMKNTLWSASIAAAGALTVWLFTGSLWCIAPGAMIFAAMVLLFGKRAEQRAAEDALRQAKADSDPRALAARLAEQIRELARVQSDIRSESIRDALTPTLQTLGNVQDFWADNPDKALPMRQLAAHYLPTLLEAMRHYERAEEYGFSDEGKFAAFVAKMNDGLAEMFRRRFADSQILVDADMEVAMDLLRQSGLTQNAAASDGR